MRLRALDLFAECTPGQLRRIEAMTTMIEVGAGRILCRQGQPGREFFVVVEGEASVTVDAADVATLSSGCGFGEIALLTPNGRRTATVTAATPMTLVMFDRSEFARLMEIALTATRRILQESTRRLAATSDERGRPAAFS